MEYGRIVRGALLGSVGLFLFSMTAWGAEHRCEAEPLELCAIPGTLGEHLSHGDPFDYDPAGIAVNRIKGSYDEQNGKLSWRETPSAESCLTKTKVKGRATRGAGGILLAYEIEATEDNGTVRATEVEETWQGCQLTRRTRPAGGSEADWLSQQGAWDSEAQTYYYVQERLSRAHGGRISLNGERHADGSWSEAYEGAYGGADVYEYWSGNADGHTNIYSERNWGDEYIQSYDDYSLDGSRSRYIRYVPEWCSSWVSYTVGYDGAGSGSASVCDIVWVQYEDEWWEDVVHIPCTLTIAAGTCTQTCDNGAVSSCNGVL
jgi:hypothetical protein